MRFCFFQEAAWPSHRQTGTPITNRPPRGRFRDGRSAACRDVAVRAEFTSNLRSRRRAAGPVFSHIALGDVRYPLLIAMLHLQAARSLMRWARRVGGPGLIVLGVVDNSPVPIPGSQDVVTIILAASEKTWWPYYALMATLGAVLGGYLTYRLARREGKALLERRVSRKKAQKIYQAFEKWGFGAVVIPALLPPPMPMFPFLLAAGAMQYSRTKFLTALTIGRAIRYTLLAFLAATYGRQIIGWMARYGKPILFTGIAAGVAFALFVLLRYKRSKRPSHQT